MGDRTFELFKGRPFSFFLDSAIDPERLGRYSFMGSDPSLVVKSEVGESLRLRAAYKGLVERETC